MNYNKTYFKTITAIKDSGVKYLVTQRRELGSIHFHHVPSGVEFSKEEINRLKAIKAGI